MMQEIHSSSPIAVVGAAGQLGSELCRQLGDAAIPLDLPDFDITKRQQVLSVLTQRQPAAVINAAGFTHVDRAEHEALLCAALNDIAVTHLTAACELMDCPLVQMSTDYVFGKDFHRSIPYAETDLPGPLNVYGESKLAGERSAAIFPWCFIVRTCGLYGEPGIMTRNANFVDKILELANTRSQIRVVKDQCCCPTYVPHLARSVLYLIRTMEFGTYHIVNPGGLTWYEFATEIVRQAGLSCSIIPTSSSEFGAAAVRPSYSVLDTAKYQALGGPPLPPWPEALQTFLRARCVPVGNEH